MILALLFWVVSMVCGVILGETKGQSVAGFLWTFLLGPLGLVVVACLPNKKAAEEEGEKKLLLQQQLYFQRKQTEELIALSRSSRMKEMINPPAPHSFRVARNGEELGMIKLAVVKTMLSNGQLSYEDSYFDPQTKDWLPLECHPELAR